MADLPLAELAPWRKQGYDGRAGLLGDHFNVQEALASSTYVKDSGPSAFARAHLAGHRNHLVGQAVCA